MDTCGHELLAVVVKELGGHEAMWGMMATSMHGAIVRAAGQVAHRLDSIMGCDVVVVMEEGSLVERGAPMQLLQRPGSRFAAMHRASHGPA